MIWTQKSAVKAGFLLGCVLLIAGLIYKLGIDQLKPEAVRSLVMSFGWWGPAIYVFLYTIRPLIFFPAIIFTLAGPLAFGPWWGTVYVVLGASLGAFLCFVIARSFGQERFRKLVGDRFDLPGLRDLNQYNGFRTILFMRIVPLFHYDVVSYGAGLANIRFRDFAIATVAGILPGAAAYNFLGYSVTDLFSPTFFAALAVFIIVMVSPLVYQLVMKR